MDTVYVAMCADVVHRGHINILEHASQYGRVIVGLLSDRAVASFKRVPFLTYEDRHRVISNLRFVDEVIQQDETTPAPYIREMKPTYFVHGDDWKNSKENFVRERVIDALNSYGGKLIEAPYTKGVSSTQLQNDLRDTERKLGLDSTRLKLSLASKAVTRGFCVRTSAQAIAVDEAQSGRRMYDVIWYALSPDNDILDMNHFFDLVESTNKPIILDLRAVEDTEALHKLAIRCPRLGITGLCVSAELLQQQKNLWMRLHHAVGREHLVLAIAGDFSKADNLPEDTRNQADILIDTGASTIDHAFSGSSKNLLGTYLGISGHNASAFREADMMGSPLHFILYSSPNDLEDGDLATLAQEILASNPELMT